MIHFANYATIKKCPKIHTLMEVETGTFFLEKNLALSITLSPNFHLKGVRLCHPKICHFGIRMTLS